MYTIDFMRAHANWRELLAAPPYCLRIVEDDNLVLFKYTMGRSDYNEPLVLECRGLIVDKATLQPVCYPFNKFFNSVEPHAAAIDWPTARVQQKVDGILVNVFFWRDQWCFSTCGTLFAGDLAPQIKADMAATGFNFAPLNPSYTYMFEWVSPTHQIVVPWEHPNFVLLGCRNMRTLREEVPPANLPYTRPLSYQLCGLKAIREAAEALDWHNPDGEGFVVVDAAWNRIKVKSPSYVMAHYVKNNGAISWRTLWDVVMAGEQDEFCGYVPSMRPQVESLTTRIVGWENEAAALRPQVASFADRKSLAQWACGNNKLMTAYLLGCEKDPHKFLQNLSFAAARRWFGDEAPSA